MRNFKYKTSFASTIRCVLESKNKFLSVASIDGLKSIIPPSASEEEDLLPFAANSCVVNMGNRNGVMVETSTALAFYKKWLHKYVDIEHDREQIVGHITNVALSKFDINYAIGAGSEILEEKDVVGTTPFNISLAGYVYKVISQELNDKILESCDPTSPSYLDISLSWELAYDEFKIAIGGQTIDECEIIEDEKLIEAYLPYLRENKGSGKLSDGRYVFKLICGDVIPLGVGLTFSPAAAVKGLVTSEVEENDEEVESDDASFVTNAAENEENIDKTKENNKKEENSENNISNSSILDVTHNTITTMKVIKSFAEIKDINDENAKEYSFANIGIVATEELERIAKEYEEKVKVERETLASAQKEAEDAKKQLETLTQEVASLKEKQTLAENEQKFNERMTALDEQFELDDEARKAIAGDINGLDTASFDKWFESFSKYAKGKCKAEAVKEDVVKQKEVKKDETTASEILDGTEAPKVTIPNSNTSQEDPNDKYKNAFKSGEGFTITI